MKLPEFVFFSRKIFQQKWKSALFAENYWQIFIRQILKIKISRLHSPLKLACCMILFFHHFIEL